MGAQVSKSKASVVRDITQNVINNTITNTVNELSTNTSTRQTIKIKGNNITCGGDFIAKQEQNSTIGVLMQANNVQLTSMASNMAANLTSSLKSQTEQGQTGLSMMLGGPQVNLDDKDVKEKITQSFINNVEKTIRNNMSVSSNNSQEIIIDIGDMKVSGNCNFTQSAAIQLMAQQITENVAKDLIVNSGDIVSKADTDTKTKQTIDASLAGILFGNMGFSAGFLLVVGILAVVFFYFQYSSHSSTPTNSTPTTIVVNAPTAAPAPTMVATPAK